MAEGLYSSRISKCSHINITCDAKLMVSFEKTMRETLLRENGLLIATGILAGVTVGIGTYGQRYRHRPFTRFIYLGATTLFLPIISYVISIVFGTFNLIIKKQEYNDLFDGPSLLAMCNPGFQPLLLVIWAFLVQIIIINTSVVVAVDDGEGQNIGPPLELLGQGVWTLYLGVLFDTGFYLGLESVGNRINIGDVLQVILFYAIVVVPFALLCAKSMFKYYAFRKAQQSFALGRNPLVISGYMQRLRQEEETSSLLHGDQPFCVDDASPPPLLVTGEDTRHVEKKPCGYVFKDDDGYGGATSSATSLTLVTIDRVWAYGHNDNMLQLSRTRLQNLCLSFALFKLLRCRFARYKLTDASSSRTLNFFWSLLLKDGEEHTRVFGVMADELSFVNDYYYSALPITFSKCWLPILSVVISLLSILGNCIVIMIFIIYLVIGELSPDYQFHCKVGCIQGRTVCKLPSKSFGIVYFDMVPVVLLVAFVVVAEVRDMASYICSNWTKVYLIGRIVNSSSSQDFLRRHKWVGLLLRCRCKLLNYWDGKMGQCSLLAIGSPRTPLLVVLRHLIRIPDAKRKVKVPEAVEVCIIDALRSCNNNGRRLSNGTSSLRRIHGGESFVWAFDGKGTCGTILIWHIATCIFEVQDKDPHQREQEHGSPPTSCSDHKIAATHLSRYGAYLVSRFPELLPEDDAWIMSLYKDVKKDVESALAGHAASSRSSMAPQDEYQKLVEMLSADSRHEVVKNGVKLGKQLVETFDGEESAWKLLASFWSEMVLYVAPSDNLKGHKEAIARGGELITLLWALLFHAGIVSRPAWPGEQDGAGRATSAGAV